MPISCQKSTINPCDKLVIPAMRYITNNLTKGMFSSFKKPSAFF